MTEKPVYSLRKLMAIPDLSVVSIFSSMPSGAAFFKFLESLTALVHESIEEYSADGMTGEATRRSVDKLSRLQNSLLKINAVNAAWSVERFLSALASGDRDRARDCFVEARRVLTRLSTAIERTRTSPGEIPPVESGCGAPVVVAPLWPAPSPAAASAGRRAKFSPRLAAGASKTARTGTPAPLNTLAKIAMLINNLEVNQADERLRALEALTFSDEIDRAVTLIREDLAGFAYAEASAKIARLIQSLSAEENGPDRRKTRKKVLVVDDMPVVLSSVKAMLEECYAVCCVTNHVSALRYLVNNTADLIILDIEMPDMDGFTLLGIIRKMERYRDVPVIFLTGHTSSENVRRAIALGGNDCIKKPVDAQTLSFRLTKYCPAD